MQLHPRGLHFVRFSAVLNARLHGSPSLIIDCQAMHEDLRMNTTKIDSSREYNNVVSVETVSHVILKVLPVLKRKL